MKHPDSLQQALSTLRSSLNTALKQEPSDSPFTEREFKTAPNFWKTTAANALEDYLITSDAAPDKDLGKNVYTQAIGTLLTTGQDTLSSKYTRTVADIAGETYGSLKKKDNEAARRFVGGIIREAEIAVSTSLEVREISWKLTDLRD